MDDSLFHSFQQIISGRTGLRARSEEREVLDRGIVARMKSLRLHRAEEYLALLGGDSTESAAEWLMLVRHITTGESYFYRDREQFALLRNRIFPALLAKGEEQRSLRIWSAGCSTGEELYSVAILLDELLPPGEERQLLIVGTDINAEAIDKARRGVYTPWSFRMVDPELMRRYFKREKDAWVLDERIRNMVTFRVSNLKRAMYPDPLGEFHDMDLIICRNTFIYFDRETIAAILGRFIDTLREGGHLLTGHGELYDQDLGALRTMIFPESVIYRKDTGSGLSSTDIPSPASGIGARCRPGEQRWQMKRAGPHMKPEAKVQSGGGKRGGDRLLSGGEPWGAVNKAKAIIAADPDNMRDHNLLARAYADMGDYDSAAAACKKALALDVTCAQPYFVLAQIAELQGDREQAKELLKKIIYLDPASVAAYLELANLYEREGDRVRARKMRATAVEFLRKLPTGSTVEPYREPAGEILRHVSRMMGE